MEARDAIKSEIAAHQAPGDRLFKNYDRPLGARVLLFPNNRATWRNKDRARVADAAASRW